MSQLETIFHKQKALVTYTVAGDPDADASVANIVALAAGGADVIEVGIPFSDPVADGPVILKAHQRALTAGTTVAGVFDILAAVREQTMVPIVLLTYLNPVFRYGYEAFFAKMADLKIDGVLIPDLPYDEQQAVAKLAAKYERDFIQLVPPTATPERIQTLVQDASGFVYVVAALGTTGQRDALDTTELTRTIATIRMATDCPVAVGFGLHTPEQVAAVAAVADGAIIGSAVVACVESHGCDAPAALTALSKTLAGAVQRAL